MKILLDENIDVRFKNRFPLEYDVSTVKDMGWNGTKNGALIQLLNQNDFDYWIVVDKNIAYQQNLSNINFRLVVLDVFRNTLSQIEKLLPQILDTINQPPAENLIVLKIPD
ncbi:MAG: hypothetical protein M3Y85_01575 [Bacteroidota bacterium]|nr:hypothetical protein [Bacteroidota bacterium]